MYRCLGLTPRDSDLTGLGCGIRTFFTAVHFMAEASFLSFKIINLLRGSGFYLPTFCFKVFDRQLGAYPLKVSAA